MNVVILANASVLLEIADNTGAIVRLCNVRTGQMYVDQLPETPCRILACYGDRATPRPLAVEGFAATVQDGRAALTWTMSEGVTLHARIELLEDGVAFTSQADCSGEVTIHLVEYPVIGGMGDWGETSELVHAFATGLLVRQPMKQFKPGEGIRYAPYPECFSGASMQFYAYYAPEKGGLLFMAEDSDAHAKWLNIYRNGDAMEGTLMYGMEDIAPGKSVAAPYAFTVRLLKGDGWWEPAQRYKEWAVRQPWCAQGRLTEREHCQWLLKEVGLTTFGVNAGRDRSAYIRRYHQDVGTTVFHVLGPDWTNNTQSFDQGNPGGMADWVPTRFNRETLDAIREVGDRFAPFEFDMMAIPGKADSEQVVANQNLFPQDPYTYSCDKYHFHMLCPCQEYTRNLHVKRDEQVTREADVDAMYYDISANNLLHICLSDKHDHPVGGGHVLTQAYKRLYRETKEACAAVKKQYFPLGTEMINEVFLPELDYYQARAGAQPCSALELWPYKELVDRGDAALIPLFAYVYHEYGAVRMDGWGKLVEEVGDLFYDNAAKIYLWGGLYELNYEYSPAEAFNGVETQGAEHYYRFAQFGYEYAPGRARYLRQFAALRTGRGNPYLAYGVMLPPPVVEVPSEAKHYYHYNHGANEIFNGVIDLPAVRVSAWKRAENRPGYAIFLANTTLHEVHIRLTLRAADYPGAQQVTCYTDFDPDKEAAAQAMGNLNGTPALTLDLKLPPRRPVMLEMR